MRRKESASPWAGSHRSVEVPSGIQENLYSLYRRFGCWRATVSSKVLGIVVKVKTKVNRGTELFRMYCASPFAIICPTPFL